MTEESMPEAVDAIAAAEKHGYARGYRAGKHRRQRDIDHEHHRREQQALLDRIYVAMLPTAMSAQGWKFGEKPISSMDDRIELARQWAEEALKQRPIA